MKEKTTTFISDAAELNDLNITLSDGVSIKASHASFTKLEISVKPIEDVWSKPWRNTPGKTEELLETLLDDLLVNGGLNVTRQKEYHTDGLLYHNGNPIGILEVKTDLTGGIGAKNQYKNLLQIIGGYLKLNQEKREQIKYFVIMTPKYVSYVPVTDEVLEICEKIETAMNSLDPKPSPSKMWANQELKDFIEELPPSAFYRYKTSDISLKSFVKKFAKDPIDEEKLTEQWVDYYSELKSEMDSDVAKKVYLSDEYVLNINEGCTFCSVEDHSGKIIATSQGIISDYEQLQDFLLIAHRIHLNN